MGYSYPSINGVIVNDARYAAWELDAEIPGAYQWQWEINSKNTAHYLFGCSTDVPGYAGFVGLDSTTEDTYKAAFNKYFDKENFSKEVVSPEKVLSIKVKDLVSSIKVFLVTADATRETVKEVERVDAAALSAGQETTTSSSTTCTSGGSWTRAATLLSTSTSTPLRT